MLQFATASGLFFAIPSAYSVPYNDRMRECVIIAHDIRSCHNVGSLFRTAEGLGVQKIYLTGYTPYPVTVDDVRLPHIRNKITKDIHKTALGAEDMVAWEQQADVIATMDQLRDAGYRIIALEQAKGSIPLPNFAPPDKTALLLGREVEGIDPQLLHKVDATVEIPMFGKKESFNVVQSAAMALYQIVFAKP